MSVCLSVWASPRCSMPCVAPEETESRPFFACRVWVQDSRGWGSMGGKIKSISSLPLSGWVACGRGNIETDCIAWTERARADTRLKKCVDPEGASRHVPPITAWTERARAHTHPPMKPAPPHTALDRGRCKGGRGGRGAPLSARAARQTNQVRHGRTAAITQRQPLLGDESHMRRLVDQLPAGFCRIYLL